MNKAIGLAALAALLLGGCAWDFGGFWDRGSRDPYIEDPYYYDSYDTVTIRDGLVEGSMGDYEGFVAPAYEQSGTTSSSSANVRLDAGDSYWVMTNLTITGGLEHEDLAPGAILVFNDETRAAAWSSTSSTPALDVDVMGCSGPTYGNYTYDSHANEVVVQVEDGLYEGERVMYFTARFDNYGTVQTTQGSFTYNTVR